jgi:hypothetical protein
LIPITRAPSSPARAYRAPSCWTSSAATISRIAAGARRERLDYLVGVDHEVLAEDRQTGAPVRELEIGERAPEAVLLGENRQRGGATALIGRDDVVEGELFADHSGRRRAALVLGDHAQPGGA